MGDTKLLQSILDGQVSIRKDIKDVKEEAEKNGDRIDKFGLKLAYLDGDAPSREEFEVLEKRVEKVENKVASV